MSFGWSIGDCFLLVNGLLKLTRLLRVEAVAGFRRYKTMYYQLSRMAETLHRFMKEVRIQNDAQFRNEIKHIRRLLKQFFSTIQELEPYLGRKRRKHSRLLLSAIEKVNWPRHSEKLSQLHQDLLSHVTILTLLNQFRIGSIHPIPETADMLSTSCFFFEDAMRKIRKIDFVSVSSWEDLHELGILENIQTLGHRLQ